MPLFLLLSPPQMKMRRGWKKKQPMAKMTTALTAKATATTRTRTREPSRSFDLSPVTRQHVSQNTVRLGRPSLCGPTAWQDDVQQLLTAPLAQLFTHVFVFFVVFFALSQLHRWCPVLIFAFTWPESAMPNSLFYLLFNIFTNTVTCSVLGPVGRRCWLTVCLSNIWLFLRSAVHVLSNVRVPGSAPRPRGRRLRQRLRRRGVRPGGGRWGRTHTHTHTFTRQQRTDSHRPFQTFPPLKRTRKCSVETIWRHRIIWGFTFTD